MKLALENVDAEAEPQRNDALNLGYLRCAQDAYTPQQDRFGHMPKTLRIKGSSLHPHVDLPNLTADGVWHVPFLPDRRPETPPRLQRSYRGRYTGRDCPLTTAGRGVGDKRGAMSEQVAGVLRPSALAERPQSQRIHSRKKCSTQNLSQATVAVATVIMKTY